MKRQVVLLVLISVMLLSLMGCNSAGNKVDNNTTLLDVKIEYKSDVPDDDKQIVVINDTEKGVMIVNPKGGYSIDLPDWWEEKFCIRVTKANQLFISYVSPTTYKNDLFEISGGKKEGYEKWLEEPDDQNYIVNEEKEVYLVYYLPLYISFCDGEEDYRAEYEKMMEDVYELEDYIIFH